jgi:hypothetical protein
VNSIPEASRAPMNAGTSAKNGTAAASNASRVLGFSS